MPDDLYSSEEPKFLYFEEFITKLNRYFWNENHSIFDTEELKEYNSVLFKPLTILYEANNYDFQNIEDSEGTEDGIHFVRNP